MWTFQQSTGKILRDGKFVGYGYAGAKDGKNDPSDQSRKNIGPLPQGKYTIGTPRDTATHGPFVLPLTPDPNNQMFGRSGFLIHGDSIKVPGTASEGCIILNRVIRNVIAKSGDKELEVTA